MRTTKRYLLFVVQRETGKDNQMRIVIETSVANDSDAHRWLDRIIYTIEDGWHLWDTTDHLDSSEFEATTWIRDGGNRGYWILELFKMSNKPEAWNCLGLHVRRIHVTNRPVNEHELSPEAAARFTQQQLCILVENRNSDGLFLKRIIEELDTALSNYWNQSSEPIFIDSVGGVDGMPGEVRNKMEEQSIKPRLVVVADSDKDSPSSQESYRARNLRDVCTEFNVPCWILSKRASENYLPASLLKEWKPNNQNHARLVEAWERLNEDQKNFCSLKSGLPKDRDDDGYPLFKGVPDADYKVLTKGFGKKVHKCWGFAGTNIESELRTRSQGDLECGIKTIRKEV